MNQLISNAPSMLAEKFVRKAVANLGSETPSSSKSVTKMVQKKGSKKMLQYDQVKVVQNLSGSHEKDVEFTYLSQVDSLLSLSPSCKQSYDLGLKHIEKGPVFCLIKAKNCHKKSTDFFNKIDFTDNEIHLDHSIKN